MRTVQWGPWAEVGMATQGNTLQRGKAGGVGGLSNAHGSMIMGSILASDECVVGAVHVKWAKFLRSLPSDIPPFLEELHTEVQRAAPALAEDASNSALVNLVGLSHEERLAAVRSAIHSTARAVVADDDLAADVPLLESGMDSLSGVEFRNRLLMEFGSGVRIPNSAVFDYPTVATLAEFVERSLVQQGATGSDASPHSIADVPAPASAVDSILERLNDRSIGAPLFLVPGAGMQSAGFRTLAALLPVPAYGVSWPKGEQRPATLAGLAQRILDEVRSIQAEGPYFFAGHSFGAAVCLEMANLVETLGERVGLVALLDPRTLPPVESDIGIAFAELGLAESLALLSQSTAEGSWYAERYDEVSRADAADRDAALRRLLTPAALTSLEHVHETTLWFAELLAGASSADHEQPRLAAQVLLVRAAETWLREPAQLEGRAEAAVRRVQERLFQADGEVSSRLSAWCGQGGHAPVSVPGDHFSLLHEPHAAATALRLCHALVDAGIAETTSLQKR